MRYFLFYYRWSSDYENGSGNLSVRSQVFPSNDELVKVAKEQTKTLSNADDPNIAILGWNEFNNKEDYESFLGKKYE